MFNTFSLHSQSHYTTIMIFIEPLLKKSTRKERSTWKFIHTKKKRKKEEESFRLTCNLDIIYKKCIDCNECTTSSNFTVDCNILFKECSYH